MLSHSCLCLHVRCRRLHSTLSAPPVKCEDLWDTETKICSFLSDRLSFHLSSNSFHLLPLIISSGVRQAQLAERDGSATIRLYNSLLLISARLLPASHMCHRRRAKNRGETTGGIGADISDWVRAGLKCLLKTLASSFVSAYLSDVSPSVGNKSNSPKELSESLARR